MSKGLKINRYEVFGKEGTDNIIYYDRYTHSVISGKEIKISDDLRDYPLFRNMRRNSIYPHNVLSKIKIPSFIIICFAGLSTLSFVLFTFIFAANTYKLHNMCFVPVIFFTAPFLILSVFLHELSHAIVAVSIGGYIAEIGFIKEGIHIRFFTKTLWQKSKKSLLPWYYFAGISMNMTLCVIGIALFVYAESLAGFTLFVINMCFVFLNSIPCKKRNTDGYNILKIIWRHKKSCLKG